MAEVYKAMDALCHASLPGLFCRQTTSRVFNSDCKTATFEFVRVVSKAGFCAEVADCVLEANLCPAKS